jgi:transposase
MSGKLSADTARALELVARGTNPHAAAKQTGIAMSTIYRALKRLRQADQATKRAANPGIASGL